MADCVFEGLLQEQASDLNEVVRTVMRFCLHLRNRTTATRGTEMMMSCMRREREAWDSASEEHARWLGFDMHATTLLFPFGSGHMNVTIEANILKTAEKFFDLSCCASRFATTGEVE